MIFFSIYTFEVSHSEVIEGREDLHKMLEYCMLMEGSQGPVNDLVVATQDIAYKQA